MSLKPLKPLTAQRSRWETDATSSLASMLDCTYSDAAGIMEVQHATVDRCYAAGAAPKRCAFEVEAASRALAEPIGQNLISSIDGAIAALRGMRKSLTEARDLLGTAP